MKREASLDARSGPRPQGILPRGATVIQCRMDLRTEPPDSSRGPLAGSHRPRDRPGVQGDAGDVGGGPPEGGARTSGRRLLNQLIDDDLVRIEGDTIVITDVDALLRAGTR